MLYDNLFLQIYGFKQENNCFILIFYELEKIPKYDTGSNRNIERMFSPELWYFYAGINNCHE